MLKDFHVPRENSSTPAGYFDDREIPAKMFNPRWTFDETLELADGIHIKNKNSAGIKMVGNATEGFLPVGKSLQVIDRVEGADDGIEPLVDVKARYILPEKANVPQSLFRDGEHRPRAIEAGHIVGFGQAPQYAARAAGDFQYGSRVGMVMLD